MTSSLLRRARFSVDETDRIANAANFSALVYHSLPDLNWSGFYFFDGAELVVGPFQGKPACVRIALGKGVCGTAAQTRLTQVVQDVHEFPGHIACDSASQSEIVVPLVAKDGSLAGVWDVDSPSVGSLRRGRCQGNGSAVPGIHGTGVGAADAGLKAVMRDCYFPDDKTAARSARTERAFSHSSGICHSDVSKRLWKNAKWPISRYPIDSGGIRRWVIGLFLK
jgi:L-methionine (R)-S-oxide reductase